MGYIGYAVIFTIILCSVILLLDKLNFARPKTKAIKLKITIPEDLNYECAFDEILNTYTNSCHIQQIKTRDFGALFELHYIIHMKIGINQKKFIDELRCRNGNLNISLILTGFEEKVYS